MHTNTEDAYVGFIGAAIKKLGLKNAIVCGASMAGQVCLAVAARNKEVGSYGTIPLQGSDYLNMERQWYDRSPYVNQALFNPEWIYGMMAPTAPLVCSRPSAPDEKCTNMDDLGESSIDLASVGESWFEPLSAVC